MKANMLIVLLLMATSTASAQILGTNYIHSNVDTVTSTAVDTTYTTATRWVSMTCWFEDGAGFVKVSSDTAIANKHWLLLIESERLIIGPATRVRRIIYKAVADTVRFFQVGYKRVDQGS